jgi:hypothetical protein
MLILRNVPAALRPTFRDNDVSADITFLTACPSVSSISSISGWSWRISPDRLAALQELVVDSMEDSLPISRPRIGRTATALQSV